MELSDSIEALKRLSEANNLIEAATAVNAFPSTVAETPDPRGVSPVSLDTAAIGSHRLRESDGSYECVLCGKMVDAIPEDETPSLWAERRCRLYAYGYFKKNKCTQSK